MGSKFFVSSSIFFFQWSGFLINEWDHIRSGFLAYGWDYILYPYLSGMKYDLNMY